MAVTLRGSMSVYGLLVEALLAIKAARQHDDAGPIRADLDRLEFEVRKVGETYARCNVETVRIVD